MSLVTLLVGEAKVPYHIYSTLLFDASMVFRACFSKESSFKEGEHWFMNLPHNNLAAVD